MRLKIASRQSDLARIQSYMVARALKRIHPKLIVDFDFKSSFGDLRLDLAIDKSPAKGLFTQDFYEDLISGKSDLVVHSWKDLPVEEKPGVRVVATLPRADVRDLFFLKKTSRKKSKLNVLSSSPRRVHNLAASLPPLLPGRPDLEFIAVRGNIPTRLKKLVESDADGLILAKAAVDRLLEAPENEFADTQRYVRDVLSLCHWCVLPLTLNPAAAAQGALAIEVLESREDLRTLLKSIQCEATFQAVSEERRILAGYGGGCHQKIGISILNRPYGRVEFLRGLTDQGQILDLRQICEEPLPAKWRAEREKIFPYQPTEARWFSRIAKGDLSDAKIEERASSVGVWISRAESFPREWEKLPFRALWISGLRSWQELAKRDVWVNGCAEAMGEQEKPLIESMVGTDFKWVKLSHLKGYEEGEMEMIPTYELHSIKPPPDIRGKTHFFWMSGSSFQRALELYPEILSEGYHGCGPGNTYKILAKLLPSDRLRVFLDFENWRHMTLIGES